MSSHQSFDLSNFAFCLVISTYKFQLFRFQQGSRLLSLSQFGNSLELPIGVKELFFGLATGVISSMWCRAEPTGMLCTPNWFAKALPPSVLARQDEASTRILKRFSDFYAALRKAGCTKTHGNTSFGLVPLVHIHGPMVLIRLPCHAEPSPCPFIELQYQAPFGAKLRLLRSTLWSLGLFPRRACHRIQKWQLQCCTGINLGVHRMLSPPK